MEKFTSHTGIGAPLRASNVDTDQILPAEFLKRITRSGFEDGLFASWRTDPEFVLNHAAYIDASILVAGPDFGTGSSREHAVWALQDYGFRVVIAPRFGDIFRGNAGKAGLLAAVIDEADIEVLWAQCEQQPGRTLTVDLEACEVTSNPQGEASPVRVPFEIDDYTRWRLLNGLDDIAITMQDEDRISAFEEQRSPLLPSVA